MNLMPKTLPLLLPPKSTEKATWNHLDTALSSMIQPQKPQKDEHLLPALHYPSRWLHWPGGARNNNIFFSQQVESVDTSLVAPKIRRLFFI